MRFYELPLIRQVFESGADDRVYDSLVLAGPIVTVAIFVGGRTVLTYGLVVLYIGGFISYLLYNAVR